MLPVRVSSLEVPPTVTSRVEAAARAPAPTLRVAVTGLVPASTSLKLMPMSGLATSSVTVTSDGMLTVGASLTAVTDRLTSAVSLVPPRPSVRVTRMARLAVEGSLVSELA